GQPGRPIGADDHSALLALLVKFGSDGEIARRALSVGADAGGSTAVGLPVGVDGTTPGGSVTARAFGAGRARSAGSRPGR
ncbi:MoxR family ATPase, partial [Gordonia terrae]